MKWNEILTEETMDLAGTLAQKAQQARSEGRIICPPQDQIFRALELTPPDKVKVVIIGQDPYHTPGQANGLAFSIANGNPIQPSLRNIFKELVSDIECDMPTTTDLTPWAEEGVLLLNATLTVEAHKANSHADWGWQSFTSEVFRACSELPQPIVYLAWGKFAQNVVHRIYPEKTTNWREVIRTQKKGCMFAPHPSPLSANRGFFGSKPFSYANSLLEMWGEEIIDWRLP